jgi:hypothetical protein
MTLTFSQLPEWLHGEIYKNIDSKNDCIIPKQIKIDLEIKCLHDILHLIDTCAYLLVDKLPSQIYEYALYNPELIGEMTVFEYNETDDKYQYFIETPEYKGIKICAMNGCVTYYTLCNHAVCEGNIPLIRFCIEDCGIIDYQHVHKAVANNRMEVLEYLLAKFPKWMHDLTKQDYYCNIAAKYGHLEMLKYLRKLGVPWSDRSIHVVILHIMSTKELTEKDTFENNRRFKCLEYMIKNGCEINEYEIATIYNNGTNDEMHSKIVRFLIEVGGVNVEFDIILMDYFARKGNTEMIEYLLNKGAHFTIYTAYYALMYKHKECFEFCLNHGAPIDYLQDHHWKIYHLHMMYNNM